MLDVTRNMGIAPKDYAFDFEIQKGFCYLNSYNEIRNSAPYFWLQLGRSNQKLAETYAQNDRRLFCFTIHALTPPGRLTH